MKSTTRIACGVLALFALRGAYAATVRTVSVPRDRPTIQAAVSSALPGDFITIAAGVYRESVRVTDRGDLTLHGEAGAVVQAVGADPAISVSGVGNTVIEGLRVTARYDAIRIGATDAAILSDLTVVSELGDGIHADGARSVTLTHNTVETAGGDGISVTMPSNGFGGPVVTGNTVGQVGGSGIYVHMAHDYLPVTVEGNTVGSAGEYGIQVECGLAQQVLGNQVTHAGLDGFSVSRGAGTCQVSGNTIGSADRNGLSVAAVSAARVENNDVASTAGDGIHLESIFQVGSVVGGNTIRFAGDDGVLLDRVFGATVGSNTIETVGGDGVSAAAALATVSVADNAISAVRGVGVRITRGGGADVVSNTLSDIGSDGILVTLCGSACFVEGNVVDGAGGAGIRADSLDAGISVTDNDIGAPHGDGVAVTGSRATVGGNTVTDAGGAGVTLSDPIGHLGSWVEPGMAGSVSANTISGSATHGIVVDRVFGVSITSNRVESSGAIGILASAAGLTVTDNSVVLAAADGICVENVAGMSHVRVEGNLVTGAGADGIDLTDTDGARVMDNTIANAGDCGVRLDAGATKNQLKRNRAEGCATWDLFESDEAGKNTLAKTNRFVKAHKKHRHGR